MSKKIIIVICILAILGIIGRVIYLEFTLPISATAVDYILMNMDTAINISDLIVLANASSDTKIRSVKEKGEDGKYFIRSYEETNFEIEKVYLGDESIQNIVCIDENSTEKIEFEKGEKSILFLRYDKQQDVYYFVGGGQGKCIYDEVKGKYVSTTLEFEDIEKEIERYNNTPEEERDIIGR